MHIPASTEFVVLYININTPQTLLKTPLTIRITFECILPFQRF